MAGLAQVHDGAVAAAFLTGYEVVAARGLYLPLTKAALGPAGGREPGTGGRLGDGNFSLLTTTHDGI